MTKVRVQPGICGLPTEMSAESDDGQTVRLSFSTECSAIAAMGKEIETVDGYAAAFSKFSESPVYQAAEKHYKHAACPVPMATTST